MVTTRSFAVLGLLLALGLAIFGVEIGQAVKKGREFDRYFTVRGLSEREVKATLAIWPIQYTVSAETLPLLREEMDKAKNIVQEYLKTNKIPLDQCAFGLPDITDRERLLKEDEKRVLPRFGANVTLVVRSRDVDTVKTAIQKSDSLISSGILLTREGYGRGVEFSYDKVSELKPAMIQEATANARAAAEKFAQDSNARVGKIRKATQGIVEIEDRDAASPELKTVRVVTTVEFFIE
jgi:uncharacterized protein